MKKFLVAAFMVFATLFCANAQKKTFLDIFQAQLTGGITMPFTNSSCTKVGTNTSASSSFYNVVNEDFDVNIAFKTDDHLSVGLGYEASGQATKRQLLTRPADEYIAGDLDSWYVDQNYPYKYGTYNYIYAQLNYSILNWYRKADWRPILYFRIGGSQKTDYVKTQAVVASTETDAIEPSSSWSVQTAFGVMLHKRIWKDLSVVLDLRESCFLITTNATVNGYYRSLDNEKEILYHSGKINGWFSADIGLSWNF